MKRFWIVLLCGLCCMAVLVCLMPRKDKTPEVSGDGVFVQYTAAGEDVQSSAVPSSGEPEYSMENVFIPYPAVENLSPAGKEIYGGCYVNGNRLTVVLTQDRPENRQLVCEELGLEQANTDFVPGTYSLAYLTELQEKITAGMMDRSLPFVVGSGVYEMENRVGITVTTEDQALINEVLKLDTLGGAILVEQGSAPVTDLTIAKWMERSRRENRRLLCVDSRFSLEYDRSIPRKEHAQ